MNRVIRDVFHDSPSRRSPRAGTVLTAWSPTVASIWRAFRPPFAWDDVLAYFAPRALPGVESVEAGVYRRTVVVDGHPGVIELHPPVSDHVQLRVHLPRWEGLIHLVQRARRVLDLDIDPAPIAEHLRRDPLLRPLVAASPGLHVPGAWDPFETAVRTVLGQQVSVRAATTLAGRLVSKFGTPVPGLTAFGLTHCFPEPETIAKADLRDLGMPAARAATIVNLAAAMACGDVVLDGARGLDETVAMLRSVDGVGPWTAQCIAMWAGGERDAFPAGDLALRRRASRPGGPLLSVAELEERAEAWHPWRAYTAAYLWPLPARHTPYARSHGHGETYPRENG